MLGAKNLNAKNETFPSSRVTFCDFQSRLFKRKVEISKGPKNFLDKKHILIRKSIFAGDFYHQNLLNSVCLSCECFQWKFKRNCYENIHVDSGKDQQKYFQRKAIWFIIFLKKMSNSRKQ